MISEIVRAIDCCGLLSDWYYPLPSFADGLVDLDHRFDNELRQYFSKLSFPLHFKVFNPAPEYERNIFRSLLGTEKGNMLLRNALLLSRLFIKNGEGVGLHHLLQSHAKIRILDFGCGNALNLIGIFAYFGLSRVEYVGIDIDQETIQECKASYAGFSNASFFVQDASDVDELKDKHGLFDLILVQHPNFESPSTLPAFTAFFTRARECLRPQGKIYSTFYYDFEASYFLQNVLSQVKGTLKQNSSFRAKLANHNNQLYCPENYSFLSE